MCFEGSEQIVHSNSKDDRTTPSRIKDPYLFKSSEYCPDLWVLFRLIEYLCSPRIVHWRAAV